MRHAEEGKGTFMIATTGGPEPEVYESQVRIWLEKPNRIREEREGTNAWPQLGIRDGRRWWTYDRNWGAMSNDDDPSVGSGVGESVRHLFDPAPLLAAVELEPVGRLEFADRPAIRARARPRPRDEHGPDLAAGRLGHGADEYELVVDGERGVLLRTAALLDGEPFAVLEVVQTAFDERFPPETFVFVPPPGEEVRSPRERMPIHDLSIEQAAELAPFTVYIPARVPPRWRMAFVTFIPGQDRPPMPPAVLIHYSTDDATHQVSLHETAAADADVEADPPWEPREVAGEEVLVWEHRLQRRVRVERDGTRVDLSSDLDLETIVELARSLVPAPTEPPRLR